MTVLLVGKHGEVRAKFHAPSNLADLDVESFDAWWNDVAAQLVLEDRRDSVERTVVRRGRRPFKDGGALKENRISKKGEK